MTTQDLKNNSIDLKVGDQLSLDFINECLEEYKFERVDFVTEA